MPDVIEEKRQIPLCHSPFWIQSKATERSRVKASLEPEHHTDQQIGQMQSLLHECQTARPNLTKSHNRIPACVEIITTTINGSLKIKTKAKEWMKEFRWVDQGRCRELQWVWGADRSHKVNTNSLQSSIYWQNLKPAEEKAKFQRHGLSETIRGIKERVTYDVTPPAEGSVRPGVCAALNYSIHCLRSKT